MTFIKFHTRLRIGRVYRERRRPGPVPGTRHVEYLEEKPAARVELPEDDLRRIEQVFPAGAAAGERYPEGGMKAVDR